MSRFKISDILLKEVMSVIKEMHIEKNKYQEHSCKKINEQISRLQKRIEQAYLDKCDGKIDEDSWKVQNRKWHSEKADLIEQLKRMNTADEKFYITCEQFLSFVKDSYKMFLNGSVEDKRFITQLVVSKCTYHAKKLDIELYPVFYSLLELPVLTGDKISTIEQSETQITSTKKAPEGAEFVNGGNDEACLGFAPSSQSFVLKPYGLVVSIYSLSGFAHFVRSIRPQIRRTRYLRFSPLSAQN